MKYLIISSICIILIVTYIYYRIYPLSATISIKGTMYRVELAVTGKEIEKGLSGRTSMPAKTGMLFIFNHKEKYPFWMRGMNFPLDFIWMDGNQIVELTKNVQPMTDGNVTQLRPNVLVDKVLELNAGEIDNMGIVVGDTALFNK